MKVWIHPKHAEVWLAPNHEAWYIPVRYLEGPNELLGYWHPVEAPEHTLQGGWFHPTTHPNLKRFAKTLRGLHTAGTRDNIQVRSGQFWRDCDKRTPRTLIVERVIPGYAFCRNIRVSEDRQSPLCRIAIPRMYRHSTGYELQ